MTNIIKAAIFGASGYTGVELIRWLLPHPNVEIRALSAETQAGKTIETIYPHLTGHNLPILQKIDAIDLTDINLVFCCLPHGTTQQIISSLPEHIRIIDLSADFRLADIESYRKWYNKPHQAPILQQQAIYGLCEINREKICTARLVANPGCYPTAAQLPLIPLLKANMIKYNNIIIDAKSGVTGAGKKLASNLLYTELNDNFSAYAIGNHRHIPEIEQGLNTALRADISNNNNPQNASIRFTTHLLPINRGILSTIYVDITQGFSCDNLRDQLHSTYAEEAFIHVLPATSPPPSTNHVRGSNNCIISVHEDYIANKAIIISVIDNLAKGAASQAVQNMNIMYNIPETTSLTASAILP